MLKKLKGKTFNKNIWKPKPYQNLHLTSPLTLLQKLEERNFFLE